MLYLLFLGFLVYLGVAHGVSIYLLLIAFFVGGFVQILSSQWSKPSSDTRHIRKWG